MHAEVEFELGGRARIVTRSNVLHGHISHPLSGRDNSIQVNSRISIQNFWHNNLP